MRKVFLIILVGLGGSIAFAEQLATGSYYCLDKDDQTIASFYVRQDGTSKRVTILSVSDADGSNSPATCNKVSFKMKDKTRKIYRNVICCMYGTN